MGQPITVVEKPSSNPGIARFETNRSLTGMSHERYGSADDVINDRPVDVLARRLFETGGVTRIHANGSVVTVHLAEGWTGAQLLDVIRGLYIFYPAATNGDAAPTAASDEAATPADAETPAEPAVAAPDAAPADDEATPVPAPAGGGTREPLGGQQGDPDTTGAVSEEDIDEAADAPDMIADRRTAIEASEAVTAPADTRAAAEREPKE